MAYSDPLDPRARASRRKHYKSNKDQYKRHNLEVREQARIVMREAKERPCEDCGVEYPSYVMDFHHRDPDQKSGYVGRMARSGLKKLAIEIAKCDVLCANCHRERTWGSDSG